MMIKCQKCGFENQMGSIFCRECGEKLNMDAIDPNKLQKDVNKEKNIKLAKKRIKGAISTGCALLIVAAFLGTVFYNGGLRQYEESSVSEASANQKYTAAVTGTSPGTVKYSYPEVNRMLKDKVVDPLYGYDSFAKVTGAEIAYDEEKKENVIYLWISIKEKVPVIYTIHGNLDLNVPSDTDVEVKPPLSLDVSRLDIGRLPIFASTHTFLDGFKTLLDNDDVRQFFARAKNIEFTADGMTVEFGQGKGTSYTPSAPSTKPSASAGVAALKSGSTAALSEKEEAARQKAEAAKQKAEEEKEKKRQLEEERKRKAEEYKQQQKQKEEERKRKAEEEKERKKQEAEERKRKAEEEAERRRQEAEDRRREREDRRNNNYNGSSRNSRSSRNSSRSNNRW